MTSRAHAAIDLIRPPPKQTRGDGLKRLTSRAKVRAAALLWRRINFAFLILSFAALLATGNPDSALAVALFAMAGVLFERQAEGPPQRRAKRILRDRRPALMNKVLLIGSPHREPRILSLPASTIVRALPPHRPRARLLSRRETVQDDDDE